MAVVDPFDVLQFPDKEPDSIISGRHVGWVRTINIDNTLFSVKYTFRKYEAIDDKDATNDPSASFEVTGSYNSENEFWVFEKSDAVPAGEEGDYAYDLLVIRNSDDVEKCIGSGYIKLYLNTDDRRTHAEIMVVKIESILNDRADSDVMNYTIKSRSITKMSPEELIYWRDYYRAEIARSGGSTFTTDVNPRLNKKNTVRVRFE